MIPVMAVYQSAAGTSFLLSFMYIWTMQKLDKKHFIAKQPL